MLASRRPRTLTTRLAALSAALGAAALVGLGSTAVANAVPTTTAAATTTAATTAATTTAATTATTTAATTTASTTAATTTEPTTAPTTAPSTGTSQPAPGPPCPGAVSVLGPVLCIPTGSGEDQPAPIGAVGFLEFAGQVVNDGPAVSDASVVITLPDGVRLDPDSDPQVSRLERWWDPNSDEDGTPLNCTTSQDGSVSTCATGLVPAGANFLILVELAAAGNAVAGTSGTLTMTLQSTPTPGTFPSTSVQATVDFVGTAHLQVQLTPTKANVTVGQNLTLVATIHNAGPNQAVDAAGIGFVVPAGNEDSPSFLITNSEPLPGSDAGSGQSFGSAFRLRAFTTRTFAAKRFAAKALTAKSYVAKAFGVKPFAAKSSAAQPSTAPVPAPFGYWPIGVIAPGGTTTVKVVVKAESVGQVELDFGALSVDETCDDPTTAGCENLATAALNAVAAVATTATTTASTTAPSTTNADNSPVSSVNGSTGTAVLANTGFEPTPWVGAAGAAIVLGTALIFLGAPRRRVCGGRHR